MYNENKEFSLKNVIIQFLFLALLVFLLIWLFPLKSDLNNLKSGDDSNLSVLVDRIFNENIISMKDAAKSYYTTSRLPQNVGDKVKMTLGEMLEKKIILPFTDKNGDACSLTDSYVEITKYDEEFVMKVNLKCGEEENYLLVYMGCYDYCSTTICEKNKSDVSTPAIYPTNSKSNTSTPANNNNNNNVINNVINNIINIITPSNDTKHYCTVVDGKYYDKNGNVVDEAAYKESCGTEEKYYCTIVDGKYYDKNGNVVNEATYKKSCGIEEKHYCTVVDGKYYDKNGNVVNETTYKKSCGIEEKYYCTVVNGKYYDDKGNVVSQAAYKKACDQVVEKEYEYRYKKTTAGTCTETNWSDWSTTPVAASSTVSVKTKTVTESKLVGYNVTKATDYSKPIYGTKEVVVGQETKDVCTQYGYVKTGEYSYGEWTYVGIVKTIDDPKDTDTERYIKVGEDNSICLKNCSAVSTKTYQRYTRKITPITRYMCTKWEKQKKDIKKTVKVITGYEKKVVSKEPVYEKTTKKLYSYKTRTCTSATTDYKWSFYNDKSLLNAGYTYTGEKREK